MTEKQKPPKAAKPRLRPGYETWGEMQPVKYPDSAAKRLGNWVVGLLTPWKR